MMNYPLFPGAQARDTSQAAATSIGDTAPILRSLTLAQIAQSDGLTADEVAERLNKSILAIRPRCTELSRLGQIQDSGDRRKNASGRSAIVWTATLRGEARPA